MIIIACGTGNGPGCTVHTVWVLPQTCANAKVEIEKDQAWYNTRSVFCIDNKLHR